MTFVLKILGEGVPTGDIHCLCNTPGKAPRGNKFSNTLGLQHKEDNPNFYCNENHYSFIVYNNNRIELKYYC